MTIKEAVKSARDELYNINVPAAMLAQIGFPLGRAIDILSACVDAMDNADNADGGESNV
jgi:hypothetical protein